MSFFICKKKNKFGSEGDRPTILGFLFCTLFMFSYLFFFKIYRVNHLLEIVESSVLLGFFMLLVLFLSFRMKNSLMTVINNKGTLFVLFACVVLILFACSITVLSFNFDFSLVKTLIHQLILLVVGVLFFSFLKSIGYEKYIIELIVFAFVLQSIIQLLGFLFPNFSEATNIFKSEESLEIKRQYASSGLRFNAISGGLAFSLATGYGVVTSIYLIRWPEFKIKSIFLKALFLILLLAGGLAAGRTAVVLSLIGLLLSVIYNCVYKKRKKDGKRFSIRLFAILFILLFVFVICFSSYRYLPNDIKTKIGFIGEWIEDGVKYYSIQSGNTNPSSSFFGEAFEQFGSINNLFFGDGLYTYSNGAYYLYADAGFVRNVGYGGFVFLFALIIYQCLFFERKRKFERISILSLILLANFKGDALAVLLQTQVVLFMIFLYDNNYPLVHKHDNLLKNCLQ